MADLKDNLWSWPTVGGTANAVTLTNMRPVGGANPYDGEMHWFIPTAANTGAATLKVDSQANAKSIFAYGAALLGGELQPNIPALVKYDGTQWQLLNPQDATGAFTITLTGFTATITGLINWRILGGKSVYVWADADILGTSNATTMSGSGVPAAIQTSRSQILPFALEDNGAHVGGSLNIAALSSSWTFSNPFSRSSGGFTGSATKGILSGACASYQL